MGVYRIGVEGFKALGRLSKTETERRCLLGRLGVSVQSSGVCFPIHHWVFEAWGLGLDVGL